MDLAKYQQSLINIRSKYSQQRPIKSKQTETALRSPANNQLIYQTPRKTHKKQEANAVMGLKGKIEDIETVLSFRQKQITERVQRNKELLSRSKDLRESEGKRNQTISPVRNNTSQRKNMTALVVQQDTVGSGEIDYLKCLLRERHIAELEQKREADRLMLQKKQNFNSHFGTHRFSFGMDTPQRQKQRDLKIKTPLVAPKQMEILSPIDGNSQTRRIQQRIQMILLK